jgi:hypothetical protein
MNEIERKLLEQEAKEMYAKYGHLKDEEIDLEQEAASISNYDVYKEASEIERQAKRYFHVGANMRLAGKEKLAMEAYRRAGDCFLRVSRPKLSICFDNAVEMAEQAYVLADVEPGYLEEQIKQVLAEREDKKADMDRFDIQVQAMLLKQIGDPDGEEISEQAQWLDKRACCGRHGGPEIREASRIFAERGYSRIAERLLKRAKALPACWVYHGRC